MCRALGRGHVEFGGRVAGLSLLSSLQSAGVGGIVSNALPPPWLFRFLEALPASRKGKVPPEGLQRLRLRAPIGGGGPGGGGGSCSPYSAPAGLLELFADRDRGVPEPIAPVEAALRAAGGYDVELG